MNVGRYEIQNEGYHAFIPNKFPSEEKLGMDEELICLLEKAVGALGKLDGITQTIPDLDFFIFMYMRKEATLSSSIEGTQATMIESLEAELEIGNEIEGDADDILHYIEAMNYGLDSLSKLPLSLRLVRNVHRVLLTEGRTDHPLEPGQFRTKQNWIGGTTPFDAKFVPPPVDEMNKALGEFEKFLNSDDPLPLIVKAGLAHSQFETIHPFIDGNGRAGRLLITFFLCEKGVLDKPVLYLSEYFKRHRDLYFELLQNYHSKGEAISWLKFFLRGVHEVSEDAITTSKKINALRQEDIKKVSARGRDPAKALKVLDHLYKTPITNVSKVQEWAGYSSRSSANDLVEKLSKHGILVQDPRGGDYARLFRYKKYLDLFS